MQNEVIFAGFGGQGILVSGKILAHAAMEAGLEVSWTPSYGPEMRGGTAFCIVIISDKPIGSPVTRNPKNLVAMNQPSLEKYSPLVRPGGIILINSSLIAIDSGRNDIDEITIPANEIANDVGSPKTANIVALSAFVARSGIVDFELLRESVKEEFAGKKRLIPINMAAMDEGAKAAQGK